MSIVTGKPDISNQKRCRKKDMKDLKLPPPKDYNISLHEAIRRRYSCRDFMDKTLSLEQVASLLWSGQGVIENKLFKEHRTVPSAGAIYPIKLFLMTGEKGVKDLSSGIYHYISTEHSLKLIREGNANKELVFACFRQDVILTAPINIIIVAEYERVTARYGKRGIRYAYMESGNVTQNIHLQAVALGLGTVVVGAFDDSEVKQVLHLKKLEPLAIMPVGYPAGDYR